ncbi:MAG: RNA polymerase sigma factor [Candidatus Limnocylindrales bacterium]
MASAPPDEPRLEPLQRSLPGAEWEAAVTEAYATWHEQLFGFLTNATRDREIAEDLLQETFLRLVAEMRAGRAPEEVRPWLYRVASNLVVSRARRRAVAGRWLSHLVVRETSDPADAELLRQERAGDLERILAHLKPEARVGLLLAAHGFSGLEVATALNRSEGSTRVLLCRARLQLRQLIEAEEAQA